MRKISLVLLFVFSAFCLKGMADTITLKDGTVIEGTITQQDDTQVTVSIKVSDTISDERILKRDDISKIDKTPEDSLAFEPLKNLKTDSWQMLSPDAYANTIAALKAFLVKYPQSSHKPEVQATLNAFQDEQAHQQAGDVKLYGNWIPKNMAATRQIQIDAQSVFINMQASASQGDLIGALNTFDKLEKNYSGTRIFPTAVERAESYQLALLVDVNNAVQTLKLKDEEWKQGVAITAEPEKSQMIAARQDEIAKYDAILETSQKANVKWPPFIPQSQKSLDDLAGVLATDKDRLLSLPVGKMNGSIAESDRAAELITSNELTAAEPHLKNALLLWSANEEAMYLRKISDAMKAALQHPGGPAPVVAGIRTPTPKPAAPTPTPKPKPKPTPIRTPEPQPKQTLVDFLFTIPGAVTVVVCAIGLFILTSFLQKSKKDRVVKEEEQ